MSNLRGHYFKFCFFLTISYRPVARWGLGVAVAPQFLAEQLTLSQPGGADYAHHSITSPHGFSDLATALQLPTPSKSMTCMNDELPKALPTFVNIAMTIFFNPI